MKRYKPLVLYLVLIVLLVVGVLISLTSGSVDIGYRELLSWSFSGLTESSGIDVNSATIIEYIRLPRIVLVMLVGAALGLSGAVIQGLFRNPLADPSLIGVSGGAALGAVTFIVIFSGSFLPMVYVEWLKVLAAFFGSLVATLFIFYLSYITNWGVSARRFNVLVVLLVGIAFNAFAGAVISLMAYIADDLSLRELTFWMMGSFAGADWQSVWFAGPPVLLSVIVLLSLAKPMNILLLGDVEAGHLGVDVKKLQLLSLVFSALAVGASISVVGMVGFVGLIVPHALRLLMGPNMTSLLPGAALGGAVLLVYADWASRLFLAPSELPIGILTALLGAPFFLALLFSRQYGVRA